MASLSSKSRLVIHRLLLKMDKAVTDMHEVQDELRNLLAERKPKEMDTSLGAPDQYMLMANQGLVRKSPPDSRFDWWDAVREMKRWETYKGTHCLGFGWRVLNPDCQFMSYWTLVSMLFIMYEMYTTPYRLCFDQPAAGTLFFVETVMINSFFIFDFVLRFHVAYQDGDTGKMVTDMKRIAIRYAKGWMVIDCVSMFPFDWIELAVAGEVTSSSRTTKAFRLLRILRFLRLARILRMARFREALDQFEVYLETSRYKIFCLHVAKISIVMALTAHLAACIWYRVTVDSKEAYAELEGGASWAPPAYVTAGTDKWFWAMHFSMATMTTVGYGDITPKNTSEIRFVVGLLCVSSVVFAGSVGILMNHIGDLYAESQRRRTRLVGLAKYLKWRMVPQQLRKQIRQYYAFVWDNNEDIAEVESDILEKLSPTLSSDLCYQVYGHVLHGAPFLSWCAGHVVAFRRLACSCQTGFYEASDVVFELGQSVDTIMFLIHGTVTISSSSLETVRAKLSEEFAVMCLERTQVEAEDFAMPSASLAPSRKSTAPMLKKLKSTVQKLMKEQKELRPDTLFRDAYLEARKVRVAADNSDSLDDSIPLSWVTEPGFFGESCLWGSDDASVGEPTAYTILCYTRCEFTLITKAAVFALLDDYPKLQARFTIFKKTVVSTAHGCGPDSPTSSPSPNAGTKFGKNTLSQLTDPNAIGNIGLMANRTSPM